MISNNILYTVGLENLLLKLFCSLSQKVKLRLQLSLLVNSFTVSRRHQPWEWRHLVGIVCQFTKVCCQSIDVSASTHAYVTNTRPSPRNSDKLTQDSLYNAQEVSTILCTARSCISLYLIITTIRLMALYPEHPGELVP